MSDWLAHVTREVAAIGEGFCPTCEGRLLPVAGAPGNTGLCPVDGLWRAYTERDRREGGHDTWVSWTSLDALRPSPAVVDGVIPHPTTKEAT